VKLTEAQIELLSAIEAVVGGLTYSDMKPSRRAMAKRLRNQGLIGKRHWTIAQLTQAGLAALEQSKKK